MDATALFAEFAKVGILPLSMAIVIWVLWRDNVKWREDYNSMRDRMQDKIDVIAQKATDAINSAVNQANSFSGSLASLMALVGKIGDQQQALKDYIAELLRDK